LALQPDAIVENREYSRTEVQAAAGGLSANLKSDGRAAKGRDSYYLDLDHTTDDQGRPHTDFHQTTGVLMAGRQADAERTQAVFASAQRYAQDRPGKALAGNAPQDADDTSVSVGTEVHYLQRYSRDNKVAWTGKLGFRASRYTGDNPDSLAPDPKPQRRLELESRAPLAELRYDRQTGSKASLTAGLAFSGADDWNTAVVGAPGTPIIWTTYRQKQSRGTVTGYLDYERPLSANTQLRLGGKVAAAEGNTPVWRPWVSLRREFGKGQTLVLLTRPLLRDDVSELSPVDDWALRDALSPLDLGAGGYCQSYEAQYEWAPQSGSLLRCSGFYRNLNSLLVDLADPNWAPTQATVVLAGPTLRGAEVEWEQWLSRRLSGGLWVRYTDSRNADAGGLDIPYQPRFTGQAKLDYLDESGLKLGASVVHVGPRYTDVSNARRQHGYETVNLLAAKQVNLHTEWYLSVSDVLDRAGAFWQGYPGAGRETQVGVRHRF